MQSPYLSGISLLVIIPLFAKKGIIVAQDFLLVIMPCLVILLKCSFRRFFLILTHVFLCFWYFFQFESEESFKKLFLKTIHLLISFLKVLFTKGALFSRAI